ncbi:MAG: protein glxC [Proteobacteria bacterium]|nr:protein glxC [Pseudomonadota bacterium]
MTDSAIAIDLAQTSVRALNERLHRLPADTNERLWRIGNPQGAHAVAAGLTVPIQIEIDGHVGYYCAGMNEQATVTVHGHAGTGLAENIMSGVVRVTGNASQSAAASGRGGLVVIEGDASARCGISMKGVDIVVGGSIGHMSCFMGQAGSLVVCGDAGADLGDSLYEAEIFVAGAVTSLGADCIEKPMTQADVARVADLLARAGIAADAARFRHYGSARQLYHFHVDHAAAY